MISTTANLDIQSFWIVAVSYVSVCNYSYMNKAMEEW